MNKEEICFKLIEFYYKNMSASPLQNIFQFLLTTFSMHVQNICYNDIIKFAIENIAANNVAMFFVEFTSIIINNQDKTCKHYEKVRL